MCSSLELYPLHSEIKKLQTISYLCFPAGEKLIYCLFLLMTINVRNDFSLIKFTSDFPSFINLGRYTKSDANFYRKSAVLVSLKHLPWLKVQVSNSGLVKLIMMIVCWLP